MLRVGRWQTTAVLAIHAPQAMALIKGHRSRLGQNSTNHRIWGLKPYSVLVAQVYQRAKADDPYAEMTLLELERRLNRALTVIDQCHHQLDKKLKQYLPGITAHLSESKKPLLIPLNYSIPYANLGARLLGDYDLILRKIETCRALGLLNAQHGNSYLKKARRVIRGVFSTPAQYKNMGVTRLDLLQKNAKSEAAIEKLGKVSDDILQLKTCAQYGPNCHKKPH